MSGSGMSLDSVGCGVSVEGAYFTQMPSGPLRQLPVEVEDQTNTSESTADLLAGQQGKHAAMLGV